MTLCKLKSSEISMMLRIFVDYKKQQMHAFLKEKSLLANEASND